MNAAHLFASLALFGMTMVAPLNAHAEGVPIAPGVQSAGQFGTVRFPISCTPAAQGQFERAVAILHSFDYSRTVPAFKAVLEADPQCAIAYWGIAIAQRPNPLVGPYDEATLKRGLEAVRQGLALGPKTERESDWLRAMEWFYKDYDKVSQPERTLAYEQAMGRLSAKYPQDTEAAIFYALALNEAAPHSDKTYAKQRKAGAILERIYSSQPNHPGIAHYLIHSYDCTALAQRGLPFAQKYAAIAPDAPHALHMPSHTYSMLGMWAESVQSNARALDVMVQVAAKAWPGATHPGAPHSWDFMEYAYLQMGQDKHAVEVRDQAGVVRKFPIDPLTVQTALAAIPARYALERGAWKEAAALEPRGSRFPQAEAITYFARALGSARSGDAAGAQANIDKLREWRSLLEKANQPYWVAQTEAQILATSAWAALAEGKDQEALSLMGKAANLEDASEKDVAMENRLYPMRELLGELLIELKQPKAASREFEASLRSAPNRLRSLYGAAKAAHMAKDDVTAARYFDKLVILTADADTERPEIQEARHYREKAKSASIN